MRQTQVEKSKCQILSRQEKKRVARLNAACICFSLHHRHRLHFQRDSNPDGADLDRIALGTGLSKRVRGVCGHGRDIAFDHIQLYYNLFFIKKL